MTLREYQEATRRTAIYRQTMDDLHLPRWLYSSLGLGEAGEIQNLLKKILRDDCGVVTAKTKEDVSKELGDLLYYVAACADDFGLDLGDIAKENIVKLTDRFERGSIQGSGDNR